MRSLILTLFFTFVVLTYFGASDPTPVPRAPSSSAQDPQSVRNRIVNAMFGVQNVSPDPAKVDQYTQSVLSGSRTEGDIRAELVNSSQTANEVFKLYQMHLRRNPTVNEMQIAKQLLYQYLFDLKDLGYFLSYGSVNLNGTY